MNRSMKLALALGATAGSTILFSAPAAAQCADPWVTQAVQEVTGRTPRGSGQTGECNIKNYNAGSWSSYSDLKTYVQRLLGQRLVLPTAGIAGRAQVRIDRNQATQIRTVNGQQQFQHNGRWYNLIGNDGSTLVGQDGGT